MAYEWQSDIIRPDGENGTEVLDGQGVYQPQIEGGDNITIEDGKINASGTLENVNADWAETDPNDPSYIEHKPDLSIYATASGMETELAGKQNVISDLETIRSGAEAGSTAVQPGDLAAVATTGSYTSLTNTPQNIVQDASYVHTDNNFTNADKSKLDGIASGAEVNVQANWNETDPNSDAYIANKPTIPAAQQNADWNASSGVTAILNKPDLSAYATDSELADGLATKQNVISDLDSIRSGAALGATAAQPSDLPSSDELLPSATSGDAGKILSVDSNGDPEWITPSGGTTYSAGDGVDIDANNVISADVDGTTIGIDSTTKKIKSLQVIPTKTSDLQNDSNFVVASSLATVATSGSYTDLSNKPAIPTKTSDLQNDSNFVSSSSLATVATTGSYNDLSNKPVIPPGVTVDQTYSASSTNAQSGTAVAGAIAGVKQVPASTSSDENKVLTVNSSGNPVWEASAVPESKPLVAGSNITITENTNDVTISATAATYTAGDGIDITSGVVSADVDGTTIGIDASTKKIKSLQVIPTKTSDLQNDSNFVVASSLATVATSGSYADLSNKPAIPSVDQIYNASSTNAQSGVAVASAIADVNQVPASTSSDATKVLTVDSYGTPAWADPSNGKIEVFSWSTVTFQQLYQAIWDGKVPVIIDKTDLSSKSKTFYGYLEHTYHNSANQVVEIYFVSLPNRDELSISHTERSAKVVKYFINSSQKYRWYDTVAADFSSDGTITITNDTTNDKVKFVVANPLPASTSTDANKVLTVDSNGAAGWQNVPTPSVDEVPDVTSTDDGKILTASYSGGIGSYSWQPASGGGSSYTAGDGIAIESGEISVDFDSDTLDTVVGITTESVSAVNHSSYGDFLVMPTSISSLAAGSDNVQITLHIPGNTFYFATSADPLSYYPAHVGFAELLTSQTTGKLILDSYIQYLAVNLTGTFDSAAQKCWLNEQDVSITLPVSVANNWVFDPSSGRAINGLVFSLYNQYQPVDYDRMFKCDSDTLTNPVTFTYSGGSHEVLTVKNPLPASAQADSGKVLKVNAAGNAEWSTDGFTTTAGITDIQQVAALPANPVATVLYLIPET